MALRPPAGGRAAAGQAGRPWAESGLWLSRPKSNLARPLSDRGGAVRTEGSHAGQWARLQRRWPGMQMHILGTPPFESSRIPQFRNVWQRIGQQQPPSANHPGMLFSHSDPAVPLPNLIAPGARRDRCRSHRTPVALGSPVASCWTASRRPCHCGACGAPSRR